MKRRKYDWISLRFLIASFLFIALFIPVFFRSFQLAKEKKNTSLSLNLFRPIPTLRGNIYVQDKEKNLYPVALTKINYDVYFAPFLSKNPEKDWEEISMFIKQDKKPTFDSKSSILLAKNIDSDLMEKLTNLRLNSVFFEPRLVRIYPHKEFLEPVLGFAAYDQEKRQLRGIYGIEKFYDEFLKGSEGILQKVGIFSLPERGADIILTIDFYVQRAIEEILSKAVEEYKAEGGLIVVADLEDGSIKGLAELPKYDPNKYYEIKDYSIFNTKFTENFEPGSIIKPITFFSALKYKAIDPMEVYEDTGQIVIDGWTIRNFDNKRRGIIPYREALVQSLNVGLAKIALQLGKNRLISTYNDFRISEPPLLDLPNLSKPNYQNLTKKHFRQVNLATISFGQGIAFSPAKLLEIYSAFALNGKMLSFHFGDTIIYPNQVKEKIKYKQVLKNIGEEKVFEKMKELLESVVKEQAKKADIPEFRIAGKTGTAYIPKEGGYSDEVITSFIAFFPVSKPKFLVMVKIDKPAKGLLALGTATPTFRKVAEFLIKYYNLEPDALIK